MQVTEIKQEFLPYDGKDFVEKPWGGYYILDVSAQEKVKRLVVNPGSRTSLQIHHYRSENWTIVKGKAKVTLNNTSYHLDKSGSIYIPIGATHRVENIGDDDLEIIEVQIGSILSENDILRLEDDYGRVNK